MKSAVNDEQWCQFVDSQVAEKVWILLNHTLISNFFVVHCGKIAVHSNLVKVTVFFLTTNKKHFPQFIHVVFDWIDHLCF